jgi:glyoxylase-like metal-dependent hydrolase (beta-lactamase superfamily II)
MRPAPADRVVEVENGQVVRVGELEVTGWHTPGHARHHVAWQIGRTVVTGDVAGVRIPGCDHVLPPTPPPDIDLERWIASIDLVRELDPERLLLTHYGAASDVGRLLDQLEARLGRWGEEAQAMVAAGGTVEELAGRLSQLDDREMAVSGTPRRLVRGYRMLCPMADNAAGLHRYMTRRAPVAQD